MKLFLALILFSLSLHAAPPKPQTPYGKREDVNGFIREMVERHKFLEDELKFLFSRARREPAILTAMDAPKDPKARSWQAYRQRFVGEPRLSEGLEFWRQHKAALDRAAEEHGVPPEIIVAIIGIETVYGKQMGTWRVIDAL